MCQSPFESYCLSDPDVLVRTSRSPLIVAHNESLRDIDNLGARRHAGLHREGVEEWLDSRTDLTFALTDIVILEVSVVRSADVSLDLSCHRLHSHESGTEDRLVISDGIVRGHRSVNVAFLVP